MGPRDISSKTIVTFTQHGHFLFDMGHAGGGGGDKQETETCAITIWGPYPLSFLIKGPINHHKDRVPTAQGKQENGPQKNPCLGKHREVRNFAKPREFGLLKL